MGSSGGKGGSSSSQQNLNYYGNLVGAIGWGPLDWLTAIIYNGSYLWQCADGVPLDLTADGVVNAEGYIDLTGALLDPTVIGPGGYFRLYRGLPNQAADGGAPGHPPYLDTIIVVGVNVFFGENSGSAPNFQIIGGRLPRIDTSIVAAEDNIANDRQINPVAALAELLTDDRGLGLSIDQLDSASWQAAGHWVAQDQAHMDFCFCSPLVNGQDAFREIVKTFLDPFNGYLQWTPEGKLGCYIYEWGTNPGGLPTFDGRHWIEDPEIEDGDWQDVKTEIMVTFTDRAYEFQTNSVLVPNVRAQIIRQLDDQGRLDRSNITRQAQAQSQGLEYNRRIGSAPGSGTIKIRGPFAAGLSAGSKILVNDNPEPAESGEAQLCRVEKIEQDQSDQVTLTLTTDPLLPATAYSPAWISTLPGTPVVAPTCSPIPHCLGLALPPLGWGYPPSVGFLATRPNSQVLGFHVLFGSDPDGAFADLGLQVGFAVRCGLISDIASGDATIRLQLLDGANGPDAYLAANTPGGNLVEAQDNVLLVVLAQLDEYGRVAIDENNDPIMEFSSVIQRSAVDSDTFDYSVLRGVLGTSPAAWNTGVAAWIVPFGNLVPWTHPLFGSLLGSTGYFKLIDYTSNATDESDPSPEADIVFPGSYSQAPGSSGPDDGVTPNPVTGVGITTGVEMIVLTWSNETNTPLAATLIYESDTDVIPDEPTLSVAAPQAFLFRNGVIEGTTRYYWLQEQAVSGRLSSIVGPFSATVETWPVVADIEATITAETDARILADTTEADTRATADDGLAADISTEASARESADGTLTSNLTTEVAARESADSSLGASITEEATARETADDSLAAEYVLQVTTDDGGVERVAGFRITNLGGAGGSSEFVVQADVFAVINSDGDSDSQVAPFAIEGGVVYLNTAMIQDASIVDAMIGSMTADKISAGTIAAAVALDSPLLSTLGAVYNDTFGTSSSFPATASQVNSWSGSASSSALDYIGPISTFYGWATGTGFADNRFAKSTQVFLVIASGNFGLYSSGDAGNAQLCYRIDGGAWMGVGSNTAVQNFGFFLNAFPIQITGLTGSEQIDFGIQYFTSGGAVLLTVDLCALAFNL
jgi:hypothetical protein